MRQTIIEHGFDPVLYTLEVFPKSWWDCETYDDWLAICDLPLAKDEDYYLVGGFHRIGLADANCHIPQFHNDVCFHSSSVQLPHFTFALLIFLQIPLSIKSPFDSEGNRINPQQLQELKLSKNLAERDSLKDCKFFFHFFTHPFKPNSFISSLSLISYRNTLMVEKC